MEGPITRGELLEALARLIAQHRPEDLLRVAVDGPDTAGKTTLADELAERLEGRRAVIRAGIDGFHRPKSDRLRRGVLSAEGYFHDSFDHQTLRSALLDPLGPGGDRRYRTAVFDYRSDQPLDIPVRTAANGAVLLFDGVFLLRPELRACWDLSVYLDLDEDEILRRALLRDADLMGGAATVRERYRHRYLPGQRLYRAAAQPERLADIVIDHHNPNQPKAVKWVNRA